MFFRVEDTLYYKNLVKDTQMLYDEIKFLKYKEKELMNINKKYYKEIKKYKQMVNSLENMIVKLSEYIEEKEKC